MYRHVYFAVFAVVSFAQTSDPASNDPVLSIRGLCRVANSEDCDVIVSRQRFDDLLNIIAPGPAPASAKQDFARIYAEFLAFDKAARDSGIDGSQKYRETMQWLGLKTRVELLRRHLEKQASVVSDAEIGAYYRENVSQFEEVKLSRLALPRTSFPSADREKFDRDALRTADGLRERAAAGADLSQLQKEAYDALGFTGQPPSTAVGTRRRATLPAEVSEEVFSLKPGEVSKVEKEAYSFVIYKVEARWTPPAKQVREEISREISRQKLERALKAITGGIQTELNEKYFGTK